MKDELMKLRSLLKTIRASTAMRLDFNNAQVRLGKTSICEVPNLDADTRWNSTFIMIDKCFGTKSSYVIGSTEYAFFRFTGWY